MPQAFVTRTKQLYAVFDERPCTVYELADENPDVSTFTVPVAWVVGSGHESRTEVSVQKTSCCVTLGSVTEAQFTPIVTPPEGAVSVGIGELGATLHGVVTLDPADEQVEPQSFTDVAKQSNVVDGESPVTERATVPVWGPETVPNPEPAALIVSLHVPPAATQKYV